MTFSTLLFGFAAFSRLSIAGYVLQDDYSTANFFNMFDFFTGSDPTHGFVQYVNQGTAQSSNLINTNNGAVWMGVDSTNTVSNGRPSVRLTSKKSYNQGLIILDLDHMPGGICGTWPAFWMVGSNWPSGGEIDILEGVNDQNTNAMTLHTGPGCSIAQHGGFSGSITTNNCDVKAQGQSDNAGCSIADSSKQSYGSGFNANKGGVYATTWTSEYISVHFFPRGSIPSDIASGNPTPSSWGTPQANFSGACDFKTKFKDLQIVFDTTFCGDWAGNVWSTGSCASKANTCESFVGQNPSAFKDTFWSINSLKVYQQGGDVKSSSLVSSPAGSSTQKQPPTIASSSTVFVTSASVRPSSPSVPSISIKPSSPSIPSISAKPSSASVPFPFPTPGNSTRFPLPTGTGARGTAPFPRPNATDVSPPFVPTGTGRSRGFVTMTVTSYVTVPPNKAPFTLDITTTVSTSISAVVTSSPSSAGAAAEQVSDSVGASQVPESSSSNGGSSAVAPSAPEKTVSALSSDYFNHHGPRARPHNVQGNSKRANAEMRRHLRRLGGHHKH